MFVSFTNTWYDAKSQSEVANLLLFSQLERALSTSGLAGLDTLFAFMIAAELKVSHWFFKFYLVTVKQNWNLLRRAFWMTSRRTSSEIKRLWNYWPNWIISLLRRQTSSVVSYPEYHSWYGMKNIFPFWIAGQPAKTYGNYAVRLQKIFPLLLDRLLKIGQLQLLRRCCSHQLKSTASFDSGLLWKALETLSMQVSDLIFKFSIRSLTFF